MFRALALHVAASTLLVHCAAFAEAPLPLKDLRESATISIDAEGIAHVRANNEHDLYFLQGWTHARERLFQMDYFRRVASGTVAELVGSAGLPNDILLRTIGLRRAAERSLAAASERTRSALAAYAEGVNAWTASHPLPVEYRALEVSAIAPWSPLDSLAVGKLIAFQQSFDDDTVATVAFLSYQAAFGPARANALFHLDLWRSAGFDADATVPDASGSAGMAGASAPAAASVETSDAVIKLMREHFEHARKVPALRGALSREARGGSNLWAISGPLTRDGRPLIANDPHVALSIPALFYPMGLELDEEPVFGGSIAGAPGIIHGYNRYIAWGTTNSFTDVTDWFNEQVVPDPASPSGLSTVYRDTREPLVPIPQVFRVNVVGDGVSNNLAVVPPSSTVPPATLIVPRRDHGPIVKLDLATGAALSVQWVGFGPTQELESFMMINRARNLAEFKDALQRFDAGAQNFVYGDIEGNIAFFSAGEVPVREDLQAGAPGAPWFVRNGQGGHEWLAVQHPQPSQATPHEIVPFDEMPQLVNPPAGWFVNANNDPLGLTADNNPVNELRAGGGLAYLAYSFNAGMRAQRINTRLRALLATGDQRISFEEMQAVQADNVLRDAEVLKPHLLAAFSGTSTVPELVALRADPRVREAVARLAAWNGSTPASSVEASIYAAWRARMIARLIDLPLSSPFGPLPRPDEQDSIRALRYMLDNFATLHGVGHSGIDFFAASAVGGSADDRRDYALLKSLSEGLDSLAGLFGSASQDRYVWGELHRVTLAHPLGAALSVPPVPTDGGFQTVDPGLANVRAAARADFVYAFGAGHRSVYELDWRRNRAASIWADAKFLSRWVANQAIPLLLGKQEVKRSGAELEHYVPMP